MASRVNDVCGESVIHVITSEISRQRAGRVFALVKKIKRFDFNKRGCFLSFRIGISSLSSPLPPPGPDIPRDEENR